MSQASVHQKAAAVRDHRETIEARVTDGTLTLQALFVESADDPVLADTKLLGLVESIPDIGKVQTRRAFEAIGIAETVRVAATSADERVQLAERLGLQ